MEYKRIEITFKEYNTMSVYFLEIDSDLFIMFTMLGSLFMPLGLVFAILGL
mgnify:CR=1 FL=1